MSFRQSLFYTFTSKYLLLIIQFGSTLVLSRLLTPTDIGIYTIAYSIVSIGHVFRDFGVGNYIYQEKELTTDRIRAAMAITLFFAWSICLVLYFGASYAAEFYQEEGVKKVFQVLAINFFLIPFGSVTTSYIRRQMKFKFVMKLEVMASLISTATVISLAYAGFSYMSMAWSSVAGLVFEITILIAYRPKELPRLPGVKEIKHVLGFSVASVSESLLTQLGIYLPDLIIGRFLGMYSVGILSRAQGTIRLFDRAVTDGISPVLLPYFSKENREGGDIKAPFLYVTSCITGLSWPIFAYMAIMSEPLIHILYGEQWGGAVILLKIICIRAALWKLLGFIHPVLMSKGMVGILLKLQMVFIPLYIFVVIISVGHGLIDMLWFVTVFSFFRLLLTLKIACNALKIKIIEIFNITIKCFIPTAICSVGVFLFQYSYMYKFSQLDMLIFSAIVFVSLFILSISLIKHPIYIEITKLLKK